MSFKNYLNKALNEAPFEDEEDDPHSEKNLGAGIYWAKNTFLHGRVHKIRHIEQADWDELVSKYGEDENTTFYAGINFPTEEAWHGFFRAYKKNKEFTSKNYFLAFKPEHKAEAAKVATRADPNHSSASVFRNNERDYMEGYAGVVLELEAKHGTALDLVKLFDSRFAGPNRAGPTKLEADVLPPDLAFKIKKIVSKHIPFGHEINKHNVKEHFMAIKQLEGRTHEFNPEKSFDQKKYNYIINMYSNFDDEMRHHLFELVSKLKLEPPSAEFVREDQKKWFVDHELVIKLTLNLPYEYLVYYDEFTPADQKKADTIIKKQLEKLDKAYMTEIAKLPKPLHEHEFKIELHGVLEYAVAMEQYHHELTFAAHFNNSIGERYRMLNSREYLKKINSMDNQDEQRQAIRKHGEEVTSILNQMLQVKEKTVRDVLGRASAWD